MWENTSGATIIIGDVFWDIDKGLKVLIVNSSALTTRPRLVSQPRTMFESGGVRFPLVSSLRALPPRHPARRNGARSPFELTHSLHNIERCVHGPHPLHVPLTS